MRRPLSYAQLDSILQLIQSSNTIVEAEVSAVKAQISAFRLRPPRGRADEAPVEYVKTGLLEQLGGAQSPVNIRLLQHKSSIAEDGSFALDSSWANGLQPDLRMGPFLDEEGFPSWYETYVFQRQITVSRGVGSARPFLSLPLENPVPLTARQTYNLAAGTAYLSLRALDPAYPLDQYIHFKIDGGRLGFNQMPTPNPGGGNLRIRVMTTCTLELNLSAFVPDEHEESTGADAAQMRLHYPESIRFQFRPNQGELTEVNGELGLDVYGTTYTFTRNDAALRLSGQRQLLVPMSSAQADFQVTTCRSPMIALSGAAPIISAFWAWPIVQMDNLDQIAQSNGAGSVFLACDEGLQISWLGLQKGPLPLLRHTWLFEARRIILEGGNAGKPLAEQTWLLWEAWRLGFNPRTIAAEARMKFQNNSQLEYHSLQYGQEYLNRSGALDTTLDRPVATDGLVPAVQMDRVLQTLMRSHEEQRFYLRGSIPSTPFDPDTAISFALKNALFKTGILQSLTLYGRVESNDVVHFGRLILVFPLQFAAPILPDPYVSNFRAPALQTQQIFSDLQRLNAQVTWETPAEPILDFYLSGDVYKSTYPFLNSNEHQVTIFALDAVPDNHQNTQSDRVRLDKLEAEFREDLQYSRETVQLLDVSGNADRWGIGIDFTPVLIDNSNYFRTLFEINDLQVEMPGQRVRSFLLPQIQWEPLVNIPNEFAEDENGYPEVLRFPDDGFATLLGNPSIHLVPTIPKAVTEFTLEEFNNPALPAEMRQVFARFTLPFGMLSWARLRARASNFQPRYDELSANQPQFIVKSLGQELPLQGGIQIQASPHFRRENVTTSPYFTGATLQLTNGAETNPGNLAEPHFSPLGKVVTIPFNNNFGPGGDAPKVPLERINFAGYGASIFSKWLDQQASVGEVSQAVFDVWVGRTALEIVQMVSCLFPPMAKLVRTITIERKGNAIVTRYDSGWQATTDGLFERPAGMETVPPGEDYVFHNPFVHGFFNIKNIQDTATVYTEAGVELMGVYYDTDIELSYVEKGGNPSEQAGRTRVPSSRQFGYVQLLPSGDLINPATLKALLAHEGGTLGGPVDCTLNVGNSGQKMRVSRIDVGYSSDAAPTFVCTARGTMILPSEGSWSIVRHKHSNNELQALQKHETVPLIQRNGANQPIRFADPADLLANNPATDYGLLQSTGTQKILFGRPNVRVGQTSLRTEVPLLADAVRLCKSSSLFPDPSTCLPLSDDWNGGLDVLESISGLRARAARRSLTPAERTRTLYESGDFRLYIEYTTDEVGLTSNIEALIDSAASASEDRWKMPLGRVALKADLWSFTPLLTIESDFEAQNGAVPGFKNPNIIFGPKLKPFVSILQILAALRDGNYKEALLGGLDLAMSNSPDSWDYRLHAKLDIPLLKFPPELGFFDPTLKTPPVIVEVSLMLGIYYNDRFQVPGRALPPGPSTGGYVELSGTVHAQVFTLAVVSAYAVGEMGVGAYFDQLTNDLSIHLKLGGGVTLIVSIPVLATVSVTYTMGIDLLIPTNLGDEDITIGAFVNMRGRVEFLGGLLTAGLSIEAAGYVQTNLVSELFSGIGLTVSDDDDVPDNERLRAVIIVTLTFSVHVSIAWVININHDHSWREELDLSHYMPINFPG